MRESLESLFKAVEVPSNSATAGAFYAILRVPSYQNCYIGKDGEAYACFLISTLDQAKRQMSPMRFKNLDVQFGLLCSLEKANGVVSEERLTVIRCRTHDEEITRYFLSVCDTVLHMLGANPTQETVVGIVKHLASIFQKIQKPPTKTVNGLFGELYLIYRSANPIVTLSAWRSDENARFDFAVDNIRLDVKVTKGRVRTHVFSYEQCNPPTGTTAIAASMFVGHSPGGMSLQALIDGIGTRIATDADLIFKLHETVATALGRHLSEAMSVTYDMELSASSLCFYHMDDVPAVREPLPANVSGVHFRSDLSLLKSIPQSVLRGTHVGIAGFLPAE